MKAIGLTLCFCVMTLNAQTGTAAISGTVRAAEGNRPLGGSLVTLTRSDLGFLDAGKRRYSTISSPDGTFSFAGLPAGRYAICGARPPHEDYVDHCAWTLTPPQVILRVGAPITGYQVNLERGVRIEVAVDDPDGTLRRIGDERKRWNLRLAVSSDSAPPNAMHFFKSDRRSSEYYLTVPRKQGLRLIASADEADLGKKNDPPGQAKKRHEETLNLTPNETSKRVEFRYHPKKNQ